MRVNLLLADHAVVAEGKLYVSGAGWSVMGPAASPFAIAIKIDVPWNQANEKIALRLRLLGEDGQPVVIQGPLGEQPIEVVGEVEVGRPPGLTHGTDIDLPLAFPIPPLPLAPGQRYQWVLTLNDEADHDWHLPFSIRPDPLATYVVQGP